jgi:hypothetical protein
MTTTRKRDKELAKKLKAQQKRARKEQRRQQAQEQNHPSEKPSERKETKMFNNRSKTEIQDNEDLKKDIDLLRPQLNHLRDQADAERVEKQRKLLPQLDALAKQRPAEISGLQNAAVAARKKEEELQAAAEQGTQSTLQR